MELRVFSKNSHCLWVICTVRGVERLHVTRGLQEESTHVLLKDRKSEGGRDEQEEERKERRKEGGMEGRDEGKGGREKHVSAENRTLS